MKRFLVLTILLIQFFKVFSQENIGLQPNYNIEPGIIDSIFQSVCKSEQDWVIRLYVENGMSVPRYDSLGNITAQFLEGTFLFFKISENYFLQKLTLDFSKNQTLFIPEERVYIFADSINITIDTIQLLEKESIEPFVYKYPNEDVYGVQTSPDHEPHYSMFFRTSANDYFYRSFSKTDLADKTWFRDYKNLNYKHNINTVIYRIFVIIQNLICKTYNYVK